MSATSPVRNGAQRHTIYKHLIPINGMNKPLNSSNYNLFE